MAGPAGVTYRGAWSAVTSYAVTDAVLFGGTTYFATAASTGLAPDQYPAAWSVLAQGSVGPTGPVGSAATVSVGTVITGLAGTQASVTNSGTAQAAVLNFTLPGQAQAEARRMLALLMTPPGLTAETATDGSGTKRLDRRALLFGHRNA